MPRRKKLPKVPDYKGTGKTSENMFVQKSNPLLSLSESGLTLAEFKILDSYLGRINSHDPEKRFARYKKGEIEELLGITQIKPQDLEKRIKHLFQTVTIRDSNKNKGFTLISLFEKAECYRDEDGLWQIDLVASPSAMEYFFYPERIGYLRYGLRNVIKLTSRYSYILFLFLEQNRHMHLSWEVAIDDLKAILRCTADTYKAYYRFNELVLKKCADELNEKTDCKFTYEPIRKGRTVKAVRFTLEPLNGDDIPGQMTLSEITDFIPAALPEQGDAPIDDQRDLLSDACNNEFTEAEMDMLLSIIVTVPSRRLPPDNATGGSIELRRYHYLAQQYAAMSRYRPKNRLNYLVKMLQQDASSTD